jgi:chromosome segregation ATPase
MTTTRYLIARFAQAFGIYRRTQRMGDAASEMHLLREAEAQLGLVIWEKVGTIERLSIEYWNLRKLVSEHANVAERISQCEQRLDTAHEERANFLRTSPILLPELFDARLAILAKLEQLSQQRDEIVTQARDIRRIYDGLKIKLEFLTKEANQSAEQIRSIELVKQRLGELKHQFITLKAERTRVGHEIELGDKQLDQVELDLETAKKERQVLASEAFQIIGETNKELSMLRAEIGVLDTRRRQLYSEIGRYVSRHSYNDEHCAQVVKSHRGLVDVMRALRRSVALNHRLAGMS